MPTHTCQCGTKYQIAEHSIGKKAKCKKCGAVFVIEADDELFSFADEAEISREASSTSSVPPSAETPQDSVGTVFDDMPPPTPSYRAHEASGVAEDVGRPKGFLKSVLWTFLFPASVHNLICFTVVWVVLFVGYFLAGFLPIIGAFLGLIVFGWYAAFRFSIIESAAAGEEDLPDPGSSDGLLGGVVLPGFKWIGSWAVVLLPAIVYLLVAFGKGSAGGGNVLSLFEKGGSLLELARANALLAPLLILALFMWPMVVLCVALGGFQSLYRLDLIVITIIKTFPVYLLTVGFVFGAVKLEQVLTGPATGVFSFIVVGIALYFEIVSARIIGLYYHHFKHRFAWDWG